MSAFAALVATDLRLAARHGTDALMVVGFFVLAVVIFPFGVGADTDLLTRIAPGLIWVTALLASMLSLERLFLTDFEDGSLDLLTLTPLPLELVVLAKALAHWCASGLSLIIAAPVLAFVLNMKAQAFGLLLVSLALGTPTLTLIGTIGAALTIGARRGGVLISLLVLPLYIPVLIFGAAAVDAAITGLDAVPRLTVLASFALAALALAPFATAAALRQAVR